MMMIAMIAVRRTREGERERKKNKTPLKRRDPPRGVQGESSQTIFFPERETHRLEKTNAPREDPNGQARARESRGRVHFKSAWRGVDACS